ncbi:UDP-N-acetylenolpyruvoylglucosamine reductase [Anaerocolumna cellulosilytica]|uniref:UDP-N-acetylenolpyruvoylglucosamine reductase n=1 Tax=Anaerocolumna cellulosilytica TaxID=433286 RepID=A0A6S6QTH6_9FIRM|nr:UDP-N-acetylmuramate dehydrogenase [Anaerocolumna cellulosilytica]MBB5195688.1 UDP-N-acetylmuramate dehydrogenase [Anaerocolumna cellulosilytica]BCJ92976.1 UDP-N-acetylenolpyruvoylglucosamine reductase [Anaerocolumna cellulosilytica]
MNEVFYQKLQKLLQQDQILIDEPLAGYTTFRIGGLAAFIIQPKSTEEVVSTVRLCQELKYPYYVMGNGSNLLVSDKGFQGAVIKLGQTYGNITVKDGVVCAQSGVLLSKLANEIADKGLAGFEFAAGIPGTLGGAVTMNAGAYGGEIKQTIVSAKVLNKAGEVLELNKDELRLGYRKSIIQEQDMIVLEASFAFEPGNKMEIRSLINELNEKRRDKQPLEYPSAGSTFKRPEGHFAGKLIMDSGLRGYQVGNAQVSEKHCGFVINKGGATAIEVRALIKEIIQIVYNKFGVTLEPEVKLLGEFED